ncbi:MAG: zf-HC2 domain-containing protein [Acidobacteriota bacterium]|nr:zf-HC2 domain-containing protein [Acidobacteriota bacterium]
MSTCSQAETLRDYAFDELGANDRRAMEQHLAGCSHCAGELDQLRVTTAALRTLPDCEVPRRLAFVSDKIFTPSPFAGFFRAGWGFMSACALAVALTVFAYHRPVEIRTVVQTASASAPLDITKQVNDAVARAVGQVRAEDAKSTKVLLETLNRDHQREHQALMEAVNVMQNRVNTSTLLASLDSRQTGSGQ